MLAAEATKRPGQAVAKAGTFWHRWRSSGGRLVRPDIGCGCSSVVEHDLAKVGVEGSNPFARSRFSNGLRGVITASPVRSDSSGKHGGSNESLAAGCLNILWSDWDQAAP